MITIDLSDLAELDYKDKLDVIVDRVKASGWLGKTPYPDTLKDILGDLENAASSARFYLALDEILEQADIDNVDIVE